MSIRQTRREYTGQLSYLRNPKTTVEGFIAKVKRLMARQMVADGVVERKSGPRFQWNFWATLPISEDATAEEIRLRSNEVSGRVGANTRGEARAAIKTLLNIKSLPANLTLEKDLADSTRSTSAA